MSVEPVVYAVGDSITGGAYIADPIRAYGSVLLDRIYGRDHSFGRIVSDYGQCLVASGGGYPTRLVDTWGPQVLDATPTPTTVVLEIGTNDLGKVDATTMQNAYLDVVNRAKARGIEVIVGTIPPRTSAWWATYYSGSIPWGPEMDTVNAWIRSTFGSNVADFWTALAGSDHWARPETMTSDGLHPNAYGAADMAYAVPMGVS